MPSPFEPARVLLNRFMAEALFAPNRPRHQWVLCSDRRPPHSLISVVTGAPTWKVTIDHKHWLKSDVLLRL